MKYGRLTVLETWVEKRWGKSLRFARCECDCGAIVEKRMNALRSGNTKSCGCYNKDVVAQRNHKHGYSNHPARGTYYSMLTRCNDAHHNKYADYGGRGIAVCDEWQEDMKAFCEWADANGFEPGLQIDRIDNDGHYEPSNCRWVTSESNHHNMRSNVIYEGLILKDYLNILSEEYNIPFPTLRYRYYQLIKANREITRDALVNYKPIKKK